MGANAYAKMTIKLQTARTELLQGHERKEPGSTATEKERNEWGAATGVSLEGRRTTWGSSPRRQTLVGYGPLATRAGNRPICCVRHDWIDPCTPK